MRRFDCQHYRACLDYYSHHDQNFSCNFCQKYQHAKFYPTTADLCACLRLVAAVCKPAEYKALLKVTGAKDSLLVHFLELNREKNPPSVFDSEFLITHR